MAKLDPQITMNSALFSILAELSLLKEDSGKDYQEISSRIKKIGSLTHALSALELDLTTKQYQLLVPFLEDFQKIFQAAEAKLEMATARKFLSGEISLEDYQFGYEELADEQFDLISRYFRSYKKKKILFVGCGPFPVSSILLSLKDPSLKIDLLDKSKEAAHVARQVIAKCKSLKLNVLNPESIEEFDDINFYDTILFAAMVGETKAEKVRIYSRVAKNLNSKKIMLARTIKNHSAQELMYAPFPTKELKDNFEVLFKPKGNRDWIVQTLVIENKV